eukprot:323509-Pleurochrysis_carterae.AAC.1
MQQAVTTTAVARRVNVWCECGRGIRQKQASNPRGAQIFLEKRGREPSGSRCCHALRGITSAHEQTAQDNA